MFVIFHLEPLKLELGKEYNLNNMKEILEESVIGCQNEGSISDCETREYVDVLMSQCKCLPFSIRQSDEVKTLLSIIYLYVHSPGFHHLTT